MKVINFNKLTIKNFLSVGDEPVVIDFNTGLNIITGVNKDKQDRRNGVGKSTVADAIHYALFGTTIRDIKKDYIVNNITQTGCEVLLDLNITDNGIASHYVIVRKVSPSKCFLYQDDVDVTRDSIGNTTQYIEELIGSTSDVFQNCVIMSVNSTTPFMAKKKIDKRKFIEGILNLQVFSDMLSHVRAEYNIVTKDFDVECMKYEEISNSIDTYQQQYATYNAQQRDREKTAETRINENNRELDRLRSKANDIQDIKLDDFNERLIFLEDKLDKCRNKLGDIRAHNAGIRTSINMYKDVLSQLNNNNKTCPTCLRQIDENDKQHIINERSKIESKIDKLYVELENTSEFDELTKLDSLVVNKIKDIKIKRDAAKASTARLETITNDIKRITDHNKQLEQDLKSHDTLGDSIESSIKDAESRLAESQDNITSLKSQLNQLDIVKFVVSEEGVKSYIVKKILQVLNSKLAYYLKQMDANCVCVFNEYFEEQIFDEKGKLCSYFNFSGAERKNIDLACLFAFMDIRRLQGDVVYNFSMYDELLDSSLDETGIEIVINILKDRVQKFNETVYIITHRKEAATLISNNESAQDIPSEIITLVKQKGITKRVDSCA